MTKEEKELTITYLTKMQEEYIEGEGYERHPLPEYYALDLAIKLIEQQPSDDCVSREQAIKTIGTDIQLNLEGRRGLLKYSDEIKDILKALLDNQKKKLKALPPVTPTEKKDDWIPLVWDEYPTVNSDGSDDYVYAVDYSVPMPNEDEWVLITDENHNVRVVQYDGYDFGDYVREEILAWKHSPNPYIE